MAIFDIKNNELNKCILKEGETEITVPHGVTVIGRDALCGLQSATAVTLPDTVTDIADGAFYGCQSLTEITLPDSVKRLGSCAFAQCSSLKSIRLDSALTSIGNSAFWGCSSLESISVPHGVAKIGYNLFGGCLSLSAVTFPDSVTELDERSFKECVKLSCITLPNGLKSIGNMAFLNCHSLRSVYIPDSVTSIGEKAFFMCDSLSELTISDRVNSVGGDAFSDCGSVVVRSAESGETLYKAVTQTDGSSAYNFILRNIWGENGFDFAAQDSYFPAVGSDTLRYKIAFSRLMYRVELSLEAERMYVDFLHSNAKEAVQYCIGSDNEELIRQCDLLGLITADNISQLISYADECHNTAVTAILLSVADRLKADNKTVDPLSELEL